ncbi:MAG: alpha/beta hydrolase [Rickettsiales bacterium]|nr:alpha/beta hydrolase [Rickettsiales bacterium]
MIDLYFQDHNSNSKNTIILIHGLGVNGDSWKYQIDILIKAGFRLIIPDLLGFGLSKYQNEEISILNTCKDINKILKSLNIEDASIIGLSLGGVIAMQFANMYPKTVNNLVIINSFAKLPLNSIKQKLYLAFRVVIAKLLPIRIQALIIAYSLFPKNAKLQKEFYQQMQLADKNAYIKYLEAIINLDIIHSIQRITAKTLIISTNDDKIIPKSCAEILQKNILSAKLKTLDGSHAAIADNAKEVNKALLEFL